MKQIWRERSKIGHVPYKEFVRHPDHVATVQRTYYLDTTAYFDKKLSILVVFGDVRVNYYNEYTGEESHHASLPPVFGVNLTREQAIRKVLAEIDEWRCVVIADRIIPDPDNRTDEQVEADYFREQAQQAKQEMTA